MNSNRGFLYGDGCFETIRVRNGKVLHLKYHVDRLKRSFQTLAFDSSKLSFSFLNDLIQAGLHDKDSNARIRISFYRTGDGFYTPESDQWDFDIQITKLSESKYIHKCYDDIACAQSVRLYPSFYSSIKSLSALSYVLIGQEKKMKGWEECLVMNHDGRIAESSCMNLFIRNNDHILTPALSEGCIDGVMRRVIIDHLINMSYHVEETTIDWNLLKSSDEVFLTNTIRGVHSIGSLIDQPDHVFSVDLAKELHDLINQSI